MIALILREQGVKERTVVVEYPSLEKATAAYDSPAYAEALKALGDGAVRGPLKNLPTRCSDCTGLPLCPGGHRVGLPTSARLGFIRVYA